MMMFRVFQLVYRAPHSLRFFKEQNLTVPDRQFTCVFVTEITSETS